jgi:CheY-like chemotaxis protein
MVVLLDWHMPRLDGVQMLNALAADRPTARRHVYILMTVQSGYDHALSQALPTYLNVTILGKQFNLDDLYTAVAAAASRLAIPAGHDDVPRQAW